MYDLIGDIHGHASALEDLLDRLGYRLQDGVWRHPDRQVIFLGDFIDRGPEQVEAVRIARTMVEAGAARAIMGNHEFNAVAFATPDPQRPGEHLRPRNTKNRGQHAEFLAAVGEDSALHQEIVDWFRTLPLYLDLPGLRVVHACWHPQELDRLAPYLTDANQLQEAAWLPATRKGDPLYEAVEVVLKGLEVDLPEGVTFADKDGVSRDTLRVRWWDRQPATYQEKGILPDKVRERLPTVSVPTEGLPGYDDEKPVFFGHYWWRGVPAPLTPRVACLDYSVASEGKLVAYRWDGEADLQPENFVWVGEA